MAKAATKKVVQLDQHRPAARVSSPVEGSPLYGVAMLKIAMELKKRAGADLDEILRGVLTTMKLPEADFREFLANNGGLLRAIASQKQY